ncbi:hypothetical protein VMCG_04613 [Cytospora schulzeri]|uniref:3'-5' exonuclease domain-containing protein n=1 Tax=Cytospora schulzeri TaxID=448051 RepID=A0A423WRV0_9PEZI|nr:hypothetical protein VMCG_04613 [Valsa malicola]
MDGRNHPSNWRLWHPNQGLVFQQPLYPTLDAARFFTEASVVRGLETGTTASEEEMACDVSNLIRRTRTGRGKSTSRKTSKERTLEGKTTETARLVSTYKTKEVTEAQVEVIGSSDVDSGEAVEQEPPFTPLDYKMTEDAFYTASAAAEGTPESFWSYTLYRGPDGEKDGETTETKVKVHYCKTAHTAERVLQYFLDEKVIGFDLEWSPNGYRYASARKNVSLVQIASQSRIALLHLAMFPSKDKLATPTLKKIMENPDITKVGVWIKGDCSRLKKYLGIESRGIFELSHLYRQVKYLTNGRHDLINKKLVKLADQVKEILRLPLFKGTDVRASNWSQELTMDQIVYSASDAYAGVHLFATLNHQREQLNPTPPLPFHAELERPIPLAIGAQTSSSDEAEATELEIEAEAETEPSPPEDSYLDVVKAAEERLETIKERLKAAETIQVKEEDGEIISNISTTKTSTRKKSTAKASDPLESIQAEEDDGEDASSKSTAKSPTRKKSATKALEPTEASESTDASEATPLPQDTRVVAAEAWVMEYKSTHPDGKTKATAAALRAYYIWYNHPELDLWTIAAMLRDPPLLVTTVKGYVLRTVKHERQPFDVLRLKREILPDFPKAVARKAYKGLIKVLKTVDVSSKGSREMIYENEEESIPEEILVEED